ncbi:winged helix family transcriptional regulator [bacterium]|nr:winged helix family transcriptional regulator [bacterium]
MVAWAKVDLWSSLDEQEKSWCLFSLYFVGQWQEAEHLREQTFDPTSLSLFPHVVFARSIALARTGQLDKARREWLLQVKMIRSSPHYRVNVASMGWFLQAQAFFAMQKSRWATAERWAGWAVARSRVSHDLLLRAVAADMQAHAAIRLGHFSSALLLARTALDCARQLGNAGIENAIRVSLACWESERGNHPERSLKTLRSLLKEKSFHDALSQSVLLLELSRLSILRGEFSQARLLFSRAERSLATQGPKALFRQRVALIQRKALLARFTGDYAHALSILEQVDNEIPEFEVSLRLEVRGQMISALRESGEAVPEEWLRDEAEWTLQVRTEKAFQVLRRHQSDTGIVFDAQGDVLGNIIDRMHKTPFMNSVLREAISAGFCGLVFHHLRIKNPELQSPVENQLMMLPGSDVMLLSKPEGVKCLKQRPTDQILSLMRCLSLRQVPKEEIFRSIWRRRYFPERDDASVYVLVRRLREMLGDDADLVSSRRGHYSLAAGFCLVGPESHEPETRDFSQKASLAETPAVAQQGLFSSRQSAAHQAALDQTEGFSLPHPRIQELKDWLRTKSSFSAEDWQSHAKLSRPTACRDLLYAVEQGWIGRCGKGRASAYRTLKF